MTSPASTNKTSWLRDKLSRRISGQSKNLEHDPFEENGLDDFVRVAFTNETKNHLNEDWEVLTLPVPKQQNSTAAANKPLMDSNHTDGVLLQGGNKATRKTSNKMMSPILGGRSVTKSALRQDKKSTGEMDSHTRPASAGANVQKSTASSKKKLLTADNYVNQSRTPSPGIDRSSSQRSSFRRKGVSSATGTREKDGLLNEHDHSPSGGGNFSKIRDTLRIRKGKKKATKVAQYTLPDFNYTNKYQDPFDMSNDFGENSDGSSGGPGHEFTPIDIPHHRPEYCDHCQQVALGHGQTLKCTKCDFIVHKKCEHRVFVKCSYKTETDAVLQRDRVNESLEETIDDKVSSTADTSHNRFNSPATNGVQANSEKVIIGRKIREYNGKTTPVHHIHIKSRDTTIDYQGFVRVHMSIQRPIHVSTGVTRTSWYRLMRPVKEKPGHYGLDGGSPGALETAFYLPIDTNRLVHINNATTTKELIVTLLKKFCITDNPKKFSLYEEYGGDCRRLFEEDKPLTVILEGSVAGRNSKLVLRDNLCSTIQWDAFSYPELNNFITILHREEEIYASRLSDCFFQWKKCIEEELGLKHAKHSLDESKHIVNGSTSSFPLTVSTKHAPPVK